jgi:hypothetical protein
MSSALRPSPNLEDQVSVFMSTSDRVAQLYPQAPGSLSVGICDSEGYSGGILTRLYSTIHDLNYLFVVYLTMLSVAQTLVTPIGRLVSN